MNYLIADPVSAFIDMAVGSKSSNVIVKFHRVGEKEFVYNIPRVADRLLYYWIEVDLPPGRKWIGRLGHNLFKSISLYDQSEERTVQSFTPRILDFIASYEVPSYKKAEYYRYIDGNRTDRLCIPIPFVKNLPTIFDKENCLVVKLEVNDCKFTTDELEPPVITDYTVRILSIAEMHSNQLKKDKYAQSETITFPVYEEIKPWYDVRSDSLINRVYFGLYDVKKQEFTDNVSSFRLSYEECGRFICPSHHTSYIFPYFESEHFTEPNMHMVDYGDTPTNFSQLTNISAQIFPKTERSRGEELSIVILRGVKSYTLHFVEHAPPAPVVVPPAPVVVPPAPVVVPPAPVVVPPAPARRSFFRFW
jgi:hypothetical protein